MYNTWIGRSVRKSSKGKRTNIKPFKSGLLLNTVKSLTVNPHTGRLAFQFEEDDSVVECRMCAKV